MATKVKKSKTKKAGAQKPKSKKGAPKKSSISAKAGKKAKAQPSAKAGTQSKSKAKIKSSLKTKAKAKPQTKNKVKIKGKVKTTPKKSAQSKLKLKTVAKTSTKANGKKGGTKTNQLQSVIKAKKLVANKAKKGPGAVIWSDQFCPLDDRLVIEIGGESNVTPGGIIIPDTVSERPQSGKVVAVGRGHRSLKGRVRPMDVKVGDRVLFPKFAGNEIEMSGQKLLILREGDLLGIANG